MLKYVLELKANENMSNLSIFTINCLLLKMKFVAQTCYPFSNMELLLNSSTHNFTELPSSL